jgi:hypothetical protein
MSCTEGCGHKEGTGPAFRAQTAKRIAFLSAFKIGGALGPAISLGISSYAEERSWFIGINLSNEIRLRVGA